MVARGHITILCYCIKYFAVPDSSGTVSLWVNSDTPEKILQRLNLKMKCASVCDVYFAFLTQ